MVTSPSQFWVSMAKNKFYLLPEVWKGSLEGRASNTHQRDNWLVFAVYSIKGNCFQCRKNRLLLNIVFRSSLLWIEIQGRWTCTFWKSILANSSSSESSCSFQFSPLTRRPVFSFVPCPHTFLHLWLCSASSLPSPDTPEEFTASPAGLLSFFSFSFLKHMQKAILARKESYNSSVRGN